VIGSPEKMSFAQPVLVRYSGLVRRLDTVQEAIDWIAYEAPPEAHAHLLEAMNLLLLATGTSLKSDIEAARVQLGAGLKMAKIGM
jgi:hypothetical protein